MVALSATPALAARSEGYTKTRYPIVLIHGMLGFDRLFDVYTYWFGIVSGLQLGGAEVYVLAVSPLNATTTRGEQALAQLETLLAISGHDKAHLIGHSQGGLDARYVAAVRPDLVASITTVSTPHLGAALADYLLTDPRTPGDLLLTRAVELLGPLLSSLSGHPDTNDFGAALVALSSPAAVSFNQWSNAGMPTAPCGEGPPQVDGRYLFSWGGVGVLTQPLDPLDVVWKWTSQHDTEPSDGLVSRCSTHFGTVLRDDYIANHLDTVNQLFGLVPPAEANPVAVYRAHANRLQRLGL
jgi:triacylglycerol lipase